LETYKLNPEFHDEKCGPATNLQAASFDLTFNVDSRRHNLDFLAQIFHFLIFRQIKGILAFYALRHGA